MSLNASSCAAALSAANDSVIASWPSSSFTTDFANAYKAYSQAGVLSGAGGVVGSEDESILSSFMNSFTSDTTPAAFAQAMASYWATCMLIPGAGVISVSNNASSKVSAFEAAIEASYTTTESTPYYLNFITNLENVAKTIQWTVTRVGAPPTVTIETIS